MNLIILTPRHLSLLYGSTIPKPSKDIICYELDVLANPTKYIAFFGSWTMYTILFTHLSVC